MKLQGRMKMKKIRYILIAVLMLILGMTFSGYGADTIYADEIATVSDVPTILDMRILKGQAAFLTYQLPSVRYHFYSAADGTPMVEVGYPEIIKWSSSNSSIATVDNGIVYAWSEGTVTAKMSYRYVFPSGWSLPSRIPERILFSLRRPVYATSVHRNCGFQIGIF